MNFMMVPERGLSLSYFGTPHELETIGFRHGHITEEIMRSFSFEKLRDALASLPGEADLQWGSKKWNSETHQHAGDVASAPPKPGTEAVTMALVNGFLGHNGPSSGPRDQGLAPGTSTAEGAWNQHLHKRNKFVGLVGFGLEARRFGRREVRLNCHSTLVVVWYEDDVWVVAVVWRWRGDRVLMRE